tara:strand:+ start:614 stop:847 length:234 start_codon:yes stop_codon:yes gene_type:complete
LAAYQKPILVVVIDIPVRTANSAKRFKTVKLLRNFSLGGAFILALFIRYKFTVTVEIRRMLAPMILTVKAHPIFKVP